jgi:hypothetical protein
MAKKFRITAFQELDLNFKGVAECVLLDWCYETSKIQEKESDIEYYDDSDEACKFLADSVGPQDCRSVLLHTCVDNMVFAWVAPTSTVDDYKKSLQLSLDDFVESKSTSILRKKFGYHLKGLVREGLTYEDAMTVLKEVFVEKVMES